MIERKMRFMYWIFNKGGIDKLLEWKNVTLHTEHWLCFDCFKFRINGVVYKKFDKKFEEEYNKEIMWRELVR